jgi:hypothetical protein
MEAEEVVARQQRIPIPVPLAELSKEPHNGVTLFIGSL